MGFRERRWVMDGVWGNGSIRGGCIFHLYATLRISRVGGTGVHGNAYSLTLALGLFFSSFVSCLVCSMYQACIRAIPCIWSIGCVSMSQYSA